jgi:type II secretory pathway pseudopilin PulG
MKAEAPAGRQCGRATAAFTLVEVLAALFVLALVFASAVGVMRQAYSQLDNARSVSAAGAILQTELEKERMLTWDQAADTTYQPTIDSAFLSDPAIAGRFSLTRVVTPMTGRETRMLQITLTARWRTLDGIQHSRRLTTYYRRGGLYDYIARSP